MFPPDSKILIVDDMNSIREIAVKTFHDLGFQILLESKDIADAWERIQGEPRPFDLVVCSMNLRHSNALDLLIRIRKSEKFKDLPFLMTGNMGEQEKILAAIQSGADHYLLRPFQPAELLEKLAIIHDKKFKRTGT